MRIVFAGTGTFAEPAFEALLAAQRTSIVGLLTQPERDIGRRSGSSRQTGHGMATIAARHNLPVIMPPSINTPEGLAELAALHPDLVVVAAYGQLFKPNVIALPTLGFINLHASLLPKYRGAAPVAHAIWNGEAETGVTIFRITPGLDSGDMLMQRSIDIEADDTAGTLETKLAALGAEMIDDLIPKFESNAISAVKQDPTQVSKAPKLTKETGLIDWTQSAARVVNHIRAMQPWPTAYTFLHRPGQPSLRIMLNQCRVLDVQTICTPGMIDAPLTVHTGLGTIAVLTLQPAGKKPMAAAEFLRGHALPPGAFFGPDAAS